MPVPGVTDRPGPVSHTVVDVTTSVRAPSDVLVSTREMYGSKLMMPWPLDSNVDVHRAGTRGPGRARRRHVIHVRRVCGEVLLVAARRHGLADSARNSPSARRCRCHRLAPARRVVAEPAEQREAAIRQRDPHQPPPPSVCRQPGRRSRVGERSDSVMVHLHPSGTTTPCTCTAPSANAAIYPFMPQTAAFGRLQGADYRAGRGRLRAFPRARMSTTVSASICQGSRTKCSVKFRSAHHAFATRRRRHVPVTPFSSCSPASSSSMSDPAMRSATVRRHEYFSRSGMDTDALTDVHRDP